MALKITITDAGRAEIVNAENTGTTPVEITHIALGDAGYTPDPSQTALQSEVKRVSSIAGEVVADDTISVTAKDEGNDAYTVREFGLILGSGTLFAVYSQTDPILEKASPSTLLLTIDVILADLDATSLTFGDISFSNPPASETLKGVVELADQGEAEAGSDTTRAMTPARVFAAFQQFGLGVGEGGSTKTLIEDLDQLLPSGFYETYSGTANNPDNRTVTGVISLNDNLRNYQMQFTVDGDVRFRSIELAGTFNAWKLLHHSANQLDIGTTASEARTALELGNAATRSVGESAGDLMEVFAGGLLADPFTVTQLSQDLNTLTRNGSWAFGAGAPNAPTSNAGVCLVAANTSNRVAQLWINTPNAGDSLMYYRQRRDDRSWTPWQKMFNEGNLLDIGTTAESARDALNLGNAATRNVGEAAGNLLEVGAGGVLASTGPVISDIDDPTIPQGLYSTAIPTSGTFPIEKSNISLIVLVDEIGRPSQIAFSANSRETYVRGAGLDGVYTPWVKLFDSSNLLDIGTTAGSARDALNLGSAATRDDSRYAHRSNNLSDLGSAGSARTNLGLGSAATQNDNRYAHRSNNLSDLSSAGTARSNLGLGNAATRNVGEASGGVLERGSFGIGEPKSISPTLLSDVTDPGQYWITNNDAADKPVSRFCHLTVINKDGDLTQVVQSRDTPEERYYRVDDGAGWTPWRKALFDSDLAGAQQLSTNGYQQLPGGLILQWGRVSGATAQGSYPFSFPIAFPSACLQVFASLEQSAAETAGNAATAAANRNATSVSGSEIIIDTTGGVSTLIGASWYAIGH